MSRMWGIRLQNAGMLIIVMVMLLDRFIFSIHDGFILGSAGVSAVLLIAGILVVKKHDMKEQEMKERNLG